jgi:2-isopropylmalate synthase
MTGVAERTDDGHVRIFDTTLRDGEQAPGCTMTLEEKVAVAHQLARLKVDVIEAGFPAASEGDWTAVNQIAREVGGLYGPDICGLARANQRDIDLCWTAVEPAANARIHIFLATSDLHMKHKLGMTRPQVVAAAATAVTHACALGAQVEFSAEDSARTEPAFLYEVLATALDCGATTLNVPDTVGYSSPDE